MQSQPPANKIGATWGLKMDKGGKRRRRSGTKERKRRTQRERDRDRRKGNTLFDAESSTLFSATLLASVERRMTAEKDIRQAGSTLKVNFQRTYPQCYHSALMKWSKSLGGACGPLYIATAPFLWLAVKFLGAALVSSFAISF